MYKKWWEGKWWWCIWSAVFFICKCQKLKLVLGKKGVIPRIQDISYNQRKNWITKSQTLFYKGLSLSLSSLLPVGINFFLTFSDWLNIARDQLQARSAFHILMLPPPERLTHILSDPKSTKSQGTVNGSALFGNLSQKHSVQGSKEPGGFSKMALPYWRGRKAGCYVSKTISSPLKIINLQMSWQSRKGANQPCRWF